MTIFPESFVVFQGQDCLIPRQNADSMRFLDDPSLATSTKPEAVCWPFYQIPPDLFSFTSDRYSYSAFEFDEKKYGAIQIEENDDIMLKRLGIGEAIPFPVRELVVSYPSGFSRFMLMAKAHSQWASVSRFCGACGNLLVDAKENEEVKERLDDNAYAARFCPSCKRIFFPRMSPAVIILVHRENSILLGHNVRFPRNRHSLIAGFVEIGETLEEAAIREIREEAGIEVKNLRYMRSQPWPFPDSLMIGFVAEWAYGEARPDRNEIDHIAWYRADDLPELPLKGSIARYLIDSFIDGSFSKA
ncbi:MAG TPA: NAD(+) diphosphatase [Rectinema sp.]|nr:NAD(+) diphosphatase [Rectinema sp.]HPB06938.1 NAD(+) diphosphatase [Rectinema sp.]